MVILQYLLQYQYFSSTHVMMLVYTIPSVYVSLSLRQDSDMQMYTTDTHTHMHTHARTHTTHTHHIMVVYDGGF